MSESATEKSSRLHATKRGVRSVKLQGGIVGEPDRIFLLPGRRCWVVEFKSKDGRIRPRQRIVRGEYDMIGHPISVVRSFKQFKLLLDMELQATVD